MRGLGGGFVRGWGWEGEKEGEEGWGRRSGRYDMLIWGFSLRLEVGGRLVVGFWGRERGGGCMSMRMWPSVVMERRSAERRLLGLLGGLLMRWTRVVVEGSTTAT